MGFNKRWISKELILKTDENQLAKLFNADALMFDDIWSSKFYGLYRDGLTKDTVIKLLFNQNELKG
jgi:hypothetical protein